VTGNISTSLNLTFREDNMYHHSVLELEFPVSFATYIAQEYIQIIANVIYSFLSLLFLCNLFPFHKTISNFYPAIYLFVDLTNPSVVLTVYCYKHISSNDSHT
jgi:hypothetical protein